MTTPRRDFLSWLGAGGVLAAGGVPRLTVTGSDRHQQPVSDKWDMSWCDRVNGKVRAVFDSPSVAEGDAMFRAQVWRDEHNEVYGTPNGDTTAVIVFRHEAIPLVMNDAFWARFNLGKELKLKDAKGKKWTAINPIASAPPGTPDRFVSYNIPAFIASGGIVLACNFAFGEMVGRFKEADKLSSADARTRALEHLIPGVILQPSGVFAALRAQQAGCSYLLAS
ncbi:MAG: hypothetical protein ACRELE_05525 [Gemmatimonadales bacterium]